MPREYIPVAVDRRVRQAARNRCGYCLSPQHLVMARLEIEHILPVSQGGPSTEDNLWLCCPLCNKAKTDRTTGADPETGQTVRLFNPRTDRWHEHFAWTPDGLRIVGQTPIGRATVTLLHLDSDPDAILVRSYWVEAGWHPPIADEE
jgi:5-methylcytosine-specific restriction endonuclease McrA